MDTEKEELNKKVEKTMTILDATRENIDVAALNSVNITNALIIKDCIFYITNVKLTTDQINKIKSYQEQNNDIELCQEMFQRESINYFKLNSKTQQIFYKEVNEEVNEKGNEEEIKKEAKKDGILVKGTSKEYNTLYLKLIKCHTGSIKKELEKEKKQEKSNEKTLLVNSDDFGIIGGLPPRLISEYARIENGGQIIKTIKARDGELPKPNRAHLLILDAVEKLIQEEIKPQGEEQEGNEDTLLNIHSSNTTTNNNGSTIVGTNPTIVNSDDNPHSTTIQTPASESSTNINGDNNNNKSFDGYILGTPLHVSSFLLKSNIEPKKYYLFDTTGHTHQSKVSLPVKNNEQNAVFTEKDNQIKDNNKAEDNIRQYFETQLQLSDEILSDRDAVSLFTNKNNTPIKVISLNPFGLDYQNGSSACGIWSANVSAEALKHDKIVDFIIEDTKDKEHILAMFKSEFILKAAARVARKFNGFNAEIQEETREEINEAQQTIKKEADLQIDTDNSNDEENNDSNNNKHKDNSNNDRGSNNNGNNDVIITGNNNIKREADTTTYCKCKLGNSLFLIDTQYKQDSCLNMNNILLSISEEELKYNNKNGINNDIINKIGELKKELKKQYDNLENKILKENGKVLIDNFKEFLPEFLNSYGIDEKIFNSKSDAQKEYYIKGYYKTKKQELKNQIQHTETIDRLFRQSKGLDNEQLDGERLLSSEQPNSNQIQNELLDDRQSSNKQLDKNQIQNERELEMQQPEQLQQLQKEKKKQQNIQLGKGVELDQKELLLSIEEALSEIEEVKEKENNKNGRNK